MSGRLEPFKQAQDYLPRLKAVFFARWDEDKGCEITYQVPENSIRVTSTAPYHYHQNYQNTPDDHIDPPSIPHPLDQSDTYSNLDHLHPTNSDFLFEFTDVLDFILPKKHLCGHLVTICSGSAKILGFPTLIVDEEKYERNFFMFNLCFVFDKDSELLGYEPIVRKTGRVLKSLEQENSLLSTPNNSRFEIKSILEELYEELNSFSEVSIAINHPSLEKRQKLGGDDDNHEGNHEEEKIQDSIVSSTSALFLLNLKLFPFYGNPPKVEDWNVPISLVSFLKLRSEVSWDLTMFKLVPFIDGTATVHKISRLADVDLFLTRECIQHLVFFGCCILTDPFRFSNCYALVGGRMLDLLGDSNDFESIKLQEELQDYILIKPPSPNQITPPNPKPESDYQKDQDQKTSHHSDHNHTVEDLFLFNNDLDQEYQSCHSVSNLLNLYNEFKSGTTVHDWMEQNQVHKLNIDVRRFISFGTIKGFLKRLNCYPIWMLHPDLCDHDTESLNERSEQDDLGQRAYSKPIQLNHGEHNKETSLLPPAWLAVLKSLHHLHPLLSPNLSSSANKRASSQHQHHHLQEQVELSTDDRHQTKLQSTATITRRSHQNQKRHASSSRLPSTLMESTDQPKRHHSIHSIFQYQDQQESIAVQVPQDLPLKLNGAHHVDEICVQFRISFSHLEQILRYIDTLSLREIDTSSASDDSDSVFVGSTLHTLYY